MVKLVSEVDMEFFTNSINANEVAEENPPYAGTNANRGDIANPFTSTGQINPPINPTGSLDAYLFQRIRFIAVLFFRYRFRECLRISRKFHLPMYQEYNFSVQKQITPTTMIEVAYVGNVGTIFMDVSHLIQRSLLTIR